MLRKVGFKYPTAFIGGISNPVKALSQFYPQAGRNRSGESTLILLDIPEIFLF